MTACFSGEQHKLAHHENRRRGSIRLTWRFATAVLIAAFSAFAISAQSGPTQESARTDCVVPVVSILGTEGDDVIFGTPAADTIQGLGGNDVVFGLGGDDTICGGLGDDTISGARGTMC